MEGRNLRYSIKNEPISLKQRYLKSVMEKAECFITRLRWKAHLLLIKRNVRWAIWTLALSQILHLHSMNYCHRLKVTYTIWFNQLISNQLEVTFSYSHGGHKSDRLKTCLFLLTRPQTCMNWYLNNIRLF